MVRGRSVTDTYASLQNPGIQVVNPQAVPSGPQAEMTLVILGAPRGGTSALAGALAKLGLFMGDGASPPVFEGLKLARAIEGGDRDGALQIIGDYNRKHRVWAHKRPGFTHAMAEYHDALRNPVYLVIFRDPIATASRGMISGRLKGNYLKKLHQILEKYADVVRFVEDAGAAAIFVSYEKLLQDPARVIGELVECLGLETGAGQLDAAIAWVQPSPEDYLEVSRAERADGEWVLLDEMRIAGWARYVNRSMQAPPVIVLYRGEEELARTRADRSPPPAASTGDDTCGFEFDLRQLGIAPSPALRLRVKGDIRDMPRPAYSGGRRLAYLWRGFRQRLAAGGGSA